MRLVFKKGSLERISDHFVASEFDCPCDYPDCIETVIDSDLINQLELLRQLCGCSIRIGRAGGYRCDRYQEDLTRRGFETAKGRSRHQEGEAVDLSTGKHHGLDLEHLARKAGFKAVGVAGWWIHVDIRRDKDRRWEYASLAEMNRKLAKRVTGNP